MFWQLGAKLTGLEVTKRWQLMAGERAKMFCKCASPRPPVLQVSGCLASPRAWVCLSVPDPSPALPHRGGKWSTADKVEAALYFHKLQ